MVIPQASVHVLQLSEQCLIHTTCGALEVFLGGGTAPRLPHFVRVVHTIVGQPLIRHSFLTVNNSQMTVLQTLVTERQPPLTSTHLPLNKCMAK